MDEVVKQDIRSKIDDVANHSEKNGRTVLGIVSNIIIKHSNNK